MTDDGGLSASATQKVQIEEPAANQPPTAVISATTTAMVSQTVQFDGSGSSDGDGSTVKYDWDLGDGTLTAGRVVTHTYSATGTYTVTLTVTDDSGRAAIAAHIIQVEASTKSSMPSATVIQRSAMVQGVVRSSSIGVRRAW